MPELCRVCDGSGLTWSEEGDCSRCERCGGSGLEPLGVAQPERHSERYDPGPRRRIGGRYFDVDDVPPRGDRD